MENLPQDILLLVLGKLAAQDPQSLLQASYAYSMIHRLAKGNTDLWRRTLLVGSDVNRAKRQDANYRNEEKYKTLNAKLDAKILELGGYRQLVVPRYSKQTSSFQRRSAEQTSQELRRPKCDVSSFPVVREKLQQNVLTSTAIRPKLLALTRGRGQFHLWGFSKQEAPFIARKESGWLRYHEHYCKTVHFSSSEKAYSDKYFWETVFSAFYYDQRDEFGTVFGPVESLQMCEVFEWEAQECGSKTTGRRHLVRRWSGPVESVTREDARGKACYVEGWLYPQFKLCADCASVDYGMHVSIHTGSPGRSCEQHD